MEKAFCVSMLCATFVVQSCPFTFINDTDSDVFVADQHSGHAIVVPKGGRAALDPSVTGLSKFFKNEKMNFYVRTQGNAFFKKYQLVERYCVSDSHANIVYVSHVFYGLQGEQARRLYLNIFPEEEGRDRHDHAGYDHC